MSIFDERNDLPVYGNHVMLLLEQSLVFSDHLKNIILFLFAVPAERHTRMTKPQYTQLRDLVFDLVSGETDINSIDILNEFKDGTECQKLYDELYHLIEQICITSEFENDLERIQECHYDILKRISMKMFDYGWILAKKYTDAENIQSIVDFSRKN